MKAWLLACGEPVKKQTVRSRPESGRSLVMAMLSRSWHDDAMEGDSQPLTAEAEPFDEAYVLKFAEIAAQSGWTARAFHRFCDENFIGYAERRGLWPAGVRSIARDFSRLADQITAQRIAQCGAVGMSKVLTQRFQDNEVFKGTVRKLAVSDLFHPFDTLARTARTAEIMWLSQSEKPVSVGRIWRLTLLYSACVLFWFADRPPYHGLRRVIHYAALLSGAR